MYGKIITEEERLNNPIFNADVTPQITLYHRKYMLWQIMEYPKNVFSVNMATKKDFFVETIEKSIEMGIAKELKPIDKFIIENEESLMVKFESIFNIQ